MRKLIDIIHELLPEEFSKGDLIREGVTNDGLNNFNFVTEDPDNKFGTVNKDFVPTSYLIGAGTVQPNIGLFHEDGTISVSFAIPFDSKLEERYSVLENFKRQVAGMFGKFDQYKFILNSSPINPVGNQIVNSVRVVMFEMQIFYQTTDKGTFGNFREYEVRPYFSEELLATEQLSEPPVEMEEPATTDILVYEYDSEIDGYIVTSDSDKTQLTNGILSIPSTYDDGVNGEKPVKIFDGQFHQVKSNNPDAPNYNNPYIDTLYMNDNLEEFNYGVFINEITKEKLRISKNLTTLPDSFLANNQISGKYVLPDHIKVLGAYAFSNSSSTEQYGWPKNDITTFIMGKHLTDIGGRFLMNNENINEIVIFNETPPNPLAGAGEPLSDTNINTIHVPKNAITDYENASIWSEYEIKPLLEAKGYSLLSNLVKEMDYTDEEKEDIIYRIEYNKEFTEEELDDIKLKVLELSFEPIVRLQSAGNKATEIISRQIIGTNEAKALKGHSVQGIELSFYYQKDSFLAKDIKASQRGEDPYNNIYILRLKEEDEVVYERPVLLETFTILDNQGDTISVNATFRIADDILVEREQERFEGEE